MNKQNIKSKKGFTIIEVVLVLAIAGLIFLMVFVAYPALRRSQSDTARRNDMSRLVSQLATYKTNNRHLPESADDLRDFKNQYLDGDAFADPDGELYKLGTMGSDEGVVNGPFIICDNTGTTAGSSAEGTACSQTMTSTSFDNNDHRVWYIRYAKCDGETAVKSSGRNDVAIMYYLENGILCQSNAE